MSVFTTLCFGLLALAAAAPGEDQFDDKQYASKNIITRDVAVIGGGSSGTHAAISLQALGKSVVVVEKEAVLGGHTSTYVDPGTGVPINYGVQAYFNISVAAEYFARLNVSMGPFQFNPVTQVHANFKTGQSVPAPPSPGFAGYAAQAAKYPYLKYSWNLPNPVPSDLLLTFRDFLNKYNLQDVAYSVFLAGGGFANILDQLTIHVFKLIDFSYIRSISGEAFQPVSGDNGEIYPKALSLLGPNGAFLSSTVVAARRSPSGVRLVVQTPSGKKLIKASKLLITIPPLLPNINPFDPTPSERSLFSQWSYTNYFIMLLTNTGLPSGFQIANAVASDTTFRIPSLPAPYHITETRVKGLWYAWYASPTDTTEAAVKADVSAVVNRLRGAMGSNVTTPVNFLRFKSHTPFKLVVGKQAIQQGFYRKLGELQGQQSTWYTGAAFISHDASLIWNFTTTLFPKMFASRV
ncbi:FAD/NAD(P)-binding domain-containing protein [Podospora australis]|uniref:FAD/NAD(P)-binding domain-containing protein n=1 Tax=Podospora australis TaxID=1536484 RepID=A0AAN7AFK3_9PEZI|nr:FAD/NAD(P)-binding domain-containing protein [Podospora australis]